MYTYVLDLIILEQLFHEEDETAAEEQYLQSKIMKTFVDTKLYSHLRNENDCCIL